MKPIIIFDESIGEWRFKNKGDIRYQKLINKCAFGDVEQSNLSELLNQLAQLNLKHKQPPVLKNSEL